MKTPEERAIDLVKKLMRDEEITIRGIYPDGSLRVGAEIASEIKDAVKDAVKVERDACLRFIADRMYDRGVEGANQEVTLLGRLQIDLGKDRRVNGS